MCDRDLYRFFEEIGPVEYAIVLDKKSDGYRPSRYGFVTFKSQETAKSALEASTARLTLGPGTPWKGWSLSVGPAVQRKLGHHYNHYNNHHHHHQHYNQQEHGTRVWNRSRDQAQEETKPVPVVKAGPASKLRVDAEAWKGRPGQQPGETEAQQQHQLLYQQQQQALLLHFQQQQQLQYQAELHHYNMMTQQGYFPVQQQQQFQDTNTDQLMILPPTFYHPTGGVVWPQCPQLYPGPVFPQYDSQLQPQQYYHQYHLQQQCEEMQDSGYHDMTNASILAVDTSQSATYESKEMPASPVLNLSQVLHNQEETKRVGPYKRFKTFSGSGDILPKTRGVKKDSSKGERGGRAATKPVKEGIIAREREPPTVTTILTNKGKEKEIKKGSKKKVVSDLSEAEALPEPFKQLSVK